MSSGVSLPDIPSGHDCYIAMENDGPNRNRLFSQRDINFHWWLGFSMAMLVITRWWNIQIPGIRNRAAGPLFENSMAHGSIIRKMLPWGVVSHQNMAGLWHQMMEIWHQMMDFFDGWFDCCEIDEPPHFSKVWLEIWYHRYWFPVDFMKKISLNCGYPITWR